MPLPLRRTIASTALSFIVAQLSGIDALWIPDDMSRAGSIWSPEYSDPLIERAEATCGDDASLVQCGAEFPTNFCCSSGTKCLQLNTSSTITAALCCPAGQDCANINTVSCDQKLQDASAFPGSWLHAEPTTKLETCGSDCCPMGYKCENSNCKAITEDETISGSPSSTTSAPASATAASKSAASDAASSSTAELSSEQAHVLSDAFSGTSFAAGFIPGIIIGITAVAALVFFLRRRKQKNYSAEKDHRGRDTLTDLGPDLPYRRPTFHGRSISEPVVDTSSAYRTDFLNHTPPEQKNRNPQEGLSGYIVNVQSQPKAPITPAPHSNNQSPRHKGLFSHSPFVNQASSPVPTQSPLPHHLKRGTLSFQISPVRALKKQRSMHSLRRRMADVRQPTRPDMSRNSRSGSQETINVAMDTPSQNLSTVGTLQPSRYVPHFAQMASQPTIRTAGTSKSWQTTTSRVSEESTPIEDEPDYTTPTRPGRNSNVQNIGATLQSPYTPSNYPSQYPSLTIRPSNPEPPSSNGTVVRHQPTFVESSPGHKSYYPDPSKSPVSPITADPTTDFLAPPNAAHMGDDRPGRSRLSSIFPSMTDERDEWRYTNMTTFSGMMERAGLRKTLLYTKDQGDPRTWNKDSPVSKWGLGRKK